jgi:hypothetical protein
VTCVIMQGNVGEPARSPGKPWLGVARGCLPVGFLLLQVAPRPSGRLIADASLSGTILHSTGPLCQEPRLHGPVSEGSEPSGAQRAARVRGLSTSAAGFEKA